MSKGPKFKQYRVWVLDSKDLNFNAGIVTTSFIILSKLLN